MTGIDLARLLEDDLGSLPPRDLAKVEGPPVPALTAADEEDWQSDPLSLKLEKIRASFLNAKTAAEVKMSASMMPLGDWLELVVKLSPKNIQLQADVSFKHMLAELGPIDKNQYRPRAIPVEYQEVSE